MATIKNTAGTLTPPACYASEQERFEAYVAKILSVIVGGIQWETSQVAPVDLGVYWLKIDANGRPTGVRKYVAGDGKWIPILDMPILAETSAGAANAYTATLTPALSTATAYENGRRYVFVVSGTNTGVSTFAVDGLAPKTIKKHNGADVDAGDLVDGQFADVIYNSVDDWFELQTPVPPASPSLPTFQTSAEYSFPAAGTNLEIPHAHGKVPEIIRAVGVCKTTIDGWPQDFEIDITGISTDLSGPSTNEAPAYVVGASNAKINVSANASVAQIYAAYTGGQADWAAAQANFKLKVYSESWP